MNLDYEGLLSTDPKINPVFYDWTKVKVMYCDGNFHLGNRKNPIKYRGKDLYFRGGRNAL